MGEVDADLAFHALADATRRDILRRVLVSDQSVTALSRHYDMSFAAVQKHVAVLERASLVAKQRRGREQLVTGNIAAVRQAAQVFDRYEALWRARLTQFEEVLTESTKEASI